MDKFSQTWGMYDPSRSVGAEAQLILSLARKMSRPPVTINDTAEKSWNKGKSDEYWYNVLVGGANAGGKGFFSGLSYMPFGVLANGKNRKVFRWDEAEDIRNHISDMLKSGKRVRVFGHSYGGSTVANMAKDFPSVPIYALDPVSWGDRLEKIPDNVTILRPKDEYFDLKHGILQNYLATSLGGRWPKIESQPDRYIEYSGGHVDGLDEAVNGIVYKDVWDRLIRSGEAASIEKKVKNIVNPSAETFLDVNLQSPKRSLENADKNHPAWQDFAGT